MSRQKYWFYTAAIALVAMFAGVMDGGQLLPSTFVTLGFAQFSFLLLSYARAKDAGQRAPIAWAVGQCIPFIGPVVLVYLGVKRSAD
ncbi:DUF805 domain-containing protein [Paraferrimonas sedimenticola]|uniref:DUF805 domain-containing protein n=1 Tax=Paraferrimonas sedimenticola TaxID=375674 RepID=A0AA37RTZ9_9GAMM|nr:hypothetical protein [Paraferrimonas sedimenticola]GLP94877.1 hypothetical protein GCM10007895_01830 [Paraferrimonas sedimenticola]